MKSWIAKKVYKLLGSIQEPWYSLFNSMANAWILLRHPEKVSHLGVSYPDKTFYVIQNLSPYVGVAGWYDSVLGYMLRAKRKGWIPVVDPPPPMQADDGDWYAFFKGISQYTIDEVLHAKNVVFAIPHGVIHKRYNRRTIAERHKLSKEILLSDSLQGFIDKKLCELFNRRKGPIVGVRYRGTDYRYAAGHAKVPDVERFCDIVEADMRKWGVDVGRGASIFLVTEEQNALDGIKCRFPECRYVEKERFSDITNRRYLCCRRLPTLTPKMNNFMYMLEIHALARCDYLIGGVNGGVLMALNLNGNRYKGVHVLNTGVN